MLIAVSVGEAIDKYNILEIKRQKITNPNKLTSITQELNVLQDCQKYITGHPFFYSLLTYTNTVIWDTTDKIKLLCLEQSCYEEYAKLSNKIFEYNQIRFRLKNMFNILTSSNIKEQKSYVDDVCHVHVSDCNVLYTKIPEINYILIKHDYVKFICNTPVKETIHKLFKNTNYDTIQLSDATQSHDEPGTKIIYINLSEYVCNNDRHIFEFPVIKYISGGLLGDFIHQLSVIHQNYLKTGRKGILYIANIGDRFRTGIEQTYKDTYDIIIRQQYICDYKIHNGEPADINLSLWRADNMLYKCNWNELYKKVYEVDWGTTPWLNITDMDMSWQNKIIINTSKQRFPSLIKFNELVDKYGADNIVYVGFNEKEYNRFISVTGLNVIKYYKPDSLVELCKIINSCNLVVGSLSAPMAFAHAMHKQSLISCTTGDINMFNNLNTVIKKLHINTI